MLWLCLYLPDLPIELEPVAAPRAVFRRERSRRIVIASNAAARGGGVMPGDDAVTALAREPELQLVERSLPHERRAIQALAAWAVQFSSDITFEAERGVLWIEVGGSARYFGGLPTLIQQVTLGLRALGYSARTAVAPTVEASALLALEGRNGCLRDSQKVAETLGPKPLRLLALPANALRELHASGMERIEQVLALPAASIGRRFGKQVPEYLQRLIGAVPDPRRRFRISDRYRRRHECSYPIASVEGLLFPLRRLVQELQGFLRGRDKALQCLLVKLGHRDAPDTRIEVRTSSPMRDAARLLALLRDRLERVALAAPVTHIHLCVDELLQPDIFQGDLFDEAAREHAGWQALLDRLRARLGDTVVRQLGVADDHRPEKAWVMDSGIDEVSADYPARPLWLLDAKPLDEVPALNGSPERIEAGWWSGVDSIRDYYVAHTIDGSRWWLYRDVITRRWYLQGIWG